MYRASRALGAKGTTKQNSANSKRAEEEAEDKTKCALMPSTDRKTAVVGVGGQEPLAVVVVQGEELVDEGGRGGLGPLAVEETRQLLGDGVGFGVVRKVKLYQRLGLHTV